MIKKYLTLRELAVLTMVGLYGCNNSESLSLVKSSGVIEKTATGGQKNRIYL